MKNPWQITDKLPVYDNPWIKVTEYKVINPNGGKGIYGKVSFKNRAIGIVPLDEQMNTWLVGQYRFPVDKWSWEIPEGGGDIYTDPLESAKRELLEETGLKAAKWEEVQQMHLSNSVTDEYSITYLATGLSQHQARPEETEQLTVKKLPFKEALEMVMRGEITDAITVAALLKVNLML